MTTNIFPPALSSVHPREALLYHYTDYYGLSGITQSKSLWCSKIQFLNDSSELKHGMDILVGEANNHDFSVREIADLRSSVDRIIGVNVFVCSFAEDGDLLSQWRGYTKGSGVALGFSYAKLLEKAREANFILRKCIYEEDQKRQIAQQYVDRAVELCDGDRKGENFSFNLVANFIPTAAQFKNNNFSEEREWRLISPLLKYNRSKIGARPTPLGLIPYTSFNLRTGEKPLLSQAQPWRTNEDICINEVIVGPNREQELQFDSVGALFDANEAYVQNVGRSKVPFRTL